MRRAIVGFETDEVGDWIALLECGHRQHVRHRPPWQERPWVLTAAGRNGRIGALLACPACDEEGDDVAGGDPACGSTRSAPNAVPWSAVAARTGMTARSRTGAGELVPDKGGPREGGCVWIPA